jgi:hypothetical protein
LGVWNLISLDIIIQLDGDAVVDIYIGAKYVVSECFFYLFPLHFDLVLHHKSCRSGTSRINTSSITLIISVSE